jgi:hypothetical protein
MEGFVVMSILAEIAVAALGLMLAIAKKKDYGWGIALTFAIYVFYDSVRFLSINVSNTVIAILFFIASVSIFWSVWRIYKEAA